MPTAYARDIAEKKILTQRRRDAEFFSTPQTVTAALAAAIHFPEVAQNSMGFWKMDGRDKPGHDDIEGPKTLRLCVSA